MKFRTAMLLATCLLSNYKGFIAGLGLLLTTAAIVPAIAADEEVTVNDLEEAMSILAAVSGNTALMDEFNALSPEEKQFVLEAFGPNAHLFTDAMKNLQKRGMLRDQAEEKQLLMPENVVPSLPFSPRYPEGPSYSTFVDTLNDFGLHQESGDQPFPNNLKDDRCDDDGEANTQIALTAEKAAEVIAEVACEADPTGISCVGLLIPNGTKKLL